MIIDLDLSEKRWSAHRQGKRKRKEAKKDFQGEGEEDDEDSEFLSSGSGDSDESGSESDFNESEGMIPNDEVYSALLLCILCSLCFSDCGWAPLDNGATYQIYTMDERGFKFIHS